ncbi:MAG TPA: hypothetical protein VJQ56_13850 [Blastocatellia bacterium]|nr:hypothetical protein [Blastocatellia bacterium]
MFGSRILEVAIGVIFVYILVSIICSAIREGIEAWLNTRAAYLEYGIRELLHDTKAEGLARSFFNHPLINSLFKQEYKPPEYKQDEPAKPPSIFTSGKNLPAYIPSKNFALALMDIAARGPQTNAVSSHPGSPIISLDSVRANILNINNQAVQRALLTAIDSAQGDLNKAQANIEAWYDSAMDRVSGWYKRSTHWMLFCIGLVVAVGLNINTLTIADYLYQNDGTRAAMVVRAESAAKDPDSQGATYKEALEELNSYDLPIGWSDKQTGQRLWFEPDSKGVWKDWVAPILGWLMTAFAATLGAPFWFDVLNKVMVIRSTVKPREKSQEEGSEDRQNQVPVKLNTANAPRPPAPPAPGGAVAGPAPPQPVAAVPTPVDAESSIDGCDIDFSGEETTPDEELPVATGGVGGEA